MTLRDDKPGIAAHVHALLVLLGARWHNGSSAAAVTFEGVAEHLNAAYAEFEQRPEIVAHESGGIRVVRDRDCGCLDVFVKVGSITFGSPPCECEDGELLDVDCPVHPLWKP